MSNLPANNPEHTGAVPRDEPNGTPPRRGGRRAFWLVLGIVALASLVLYTLLRNVGVIDMAMYGLAPGAPAPAIEAAGWLNGPAPTPDDLAGKVLVVDAWATWCGPCRARAPELAKIHEQYHGRGVTFIGLTAEGAEQIPVMQEFFRSAGVTWSNGYGAVKTLHEFGNLVIPSVWVVGRDGKIVWNDASGTPLETGIEAALAAGR